MNATVMERLHVLSGTSPVTQAPDGTPRVAPDSVERLAAVAARAHESGLRWRIEGQAGFLPADTPADFALSTRALDRVLSVSPADLVATMEGGVTVGRLREALAPHRLWLAIDPPGGPNRTIGSVVATGTAGALRHGFGPVRDHVLGCSVVTGDGRIVEAGGRVVKNVAGYDLTKLHAAGFGGFGVIVLLHLRLRAEPTRDLTLVARGPRPALVLAAGAATAARLTLLALELASPRATGQGEWTLAARLAGTDEGVSAEAAGLSATTGMEWERLTPDRAAATWEQMARAPLAVPVSLRLGTTLDGIGATLDMTDRCLGEGVLLAGMGTGSLRWAGATDADAIRSLRRQAAECEIPVTVERAPWPLRRAVGHFGAYHGGVAPLVDRLRTTFDPARRICAALEGTDG